jgi:dihydrofolate reductase
MTVTLYMTISTDGFICRNDGSVDYALEGTWNSYFKFCKETGNLIIGKNTYDVMPKNEFIEDCAYVVMTKSVPKVPKIKNIVFTDKSPAEVIRMLNNKGYQKIGLGGGGKINSSFLNEGLIDEIILDVQPIILGEGMKIFPETEIQKSLELIKTKQLSDREIQIHYRVKNKPLDMNEQSVSKNHGGI